MRAKPVLALLLLSAATLLFEISLTRLFSVAQFYHFAFMIVSLALLGNGASGTVVAVVPRLARLAPGAAVGRPALATAPAILAAYALINSLPFDSFSIAWDRMQVVLLALHYVALAAPFFLTGLAVSLALAADPGAAPRTYAANLLGSALGCLLALFAPSFAGGEGTVVIAAGLAAAAGAVAWDERGRPRIAGRAFAALLIAFALIDAGLRASGHPLPRLALQLSPYKSLSYALQFPGAKTVYTRWNAYSRVDLVRSAGIRSLPGLSYRYLGPLPAEDGVLVDGDDLSPVVQPGGDQAWADYLPAAAAFRLRPDANALVLEPRGGLDVTAALALGARRVTAVEMNPLIVEAAGAVYRDPRVQVAQETDRSYTRRSSETFDVVVLSLVSGYHPVRSGAYSLAEDYRYTVEAFDDALARLEPDGLLVVTRWLQDPPSECLRAFALAVTAVERAGGDPGAQIIAMRGYNLAALLVKRSPYTRAELAAVRSFAAERAFDLTYAPGLRADESNRYNVLRKSVYYEAYTALLAARPREAFYAAYPFDVTPPTDDRPFFGHFFRLSQAGEVAAEVGKTWQPFGGAGYFVILALLVLAAVAAAALILLPALAARRGPRRPASTGSTPYFALIGLAFLLVEIPLIQRFILFLGQPGYAFTTVLFALLLFSGLGSRVSEHVPLQLALPALVVTALALPAALSPLFAAALGLSLVARLALTVAVLSPLGLLMGIPFPAGLRHFLGNDGDAGLIPRIWAVNGAASVISAVLAALLALSFGFTWVLHLGAGCYAGAWLTVLATARRGPAPRPAP